MGLFNLFKPKQYDMDTLDGINNIPIPAKNYNTGNDLKDCIYYLLQRKATEHKKAGRMDCAIACLRKSNALSDYERRPLLLKKDYLRLVKYIELTGDYTLAEQELHSIYQKHPEFADQRISNLIRINAAISKAKDWNEDCLFITTNTTCPVCGKYNNKIFSISKKNKKFPPLPIEIKRDGGFCKDCSLGASIYSDGLNTPPQ